MVDLPALSCACASTNTMCRKLLPANGTGSPEPSAVILGTYWNRYPGSAPLKANVIRAYPSRRWSPVRTSTRYGNGMPGSGRVSLCSTVTSVDGTAQPYVTVKAGPESPDPE